MTPQDTTGKKFLRETDARILIDRKLREASWDPEDKNQVITEETIKDGLAPLEIARPSPTGAQARARFLTRRADYILKDGRGRGIAVIEAKRFSVDPASAKQQALSYAESIKAEFIFLSNGEEIYFWDYKNRPEQKVATFYSQRDLEKIQNLRLEQKPVSVMPIPERYFKGGEWRVPRPYQKEAIHIMDKALEGGVTKYFNDESYNPYSEIAKAKAGVPWGTEVKDFVEEEMEMPAGFIQVAETASENVDVIIKRAYIEVGAEGEKIDSDDYQMAWERQIQELAKAEPLVKKVKEGQELSNDESMTLAEKLNSPKFYFNEVNLREAYHYPLGTLNEFVKTALGIKELPTEEQLYEDRITELFEAWLIDKQFQPEQTKILRLVKSQYIARRSPIEVSIFNEPIFQHIGGLNHVLQIFDSDALKQTIAELNQNVFVNGHAR